MSSSSSAPLAYRFGNWHLVPAQRLLALDEQPVKLGGRAFDMLLALVEQRHRVIGKHELMDLVWPRLVVEENNLQVQMVALRKLLGHPAIATVPGRGYRFTLPVLTEGDEADAAIAAAATRSAAREAASAPAGAGAGAAMPRGNLPAALPQLFGRDEDLRALLALMQEHRLVTVAGAGGMGKTRLAERAAAQFAEREGLIAWWVELAPVGDPALVPLAVAQALGALPGVGREAVATAAAAIGKTPTLLVLDNAEHLLDGVVAFLQALAARLPALRWLVTSQETLRLPGEQVLRLNPLPVPPAGGRIDDLGAGAAALFLARVQAADPRFALRAEQQDAVLDICRQLDGIPLALELAAARVPLLGLEGVRTRLGDRFRLLSAGSRAVLRRHQTLRAALEWSHALLSEPEQRVFRRLGVFVGGFTLEAAQIVAGDDTVDGWDVIEHVGALAEKSLVVTGSDPALTAPRCQLLETTRLFALEQLALAGETEATLQRHVDAMGTLMEFKTPLTRAYFERGQRVADAVAEVPNVRAACEWAARGGGDATSALNLRMPLQVAFGAAGLRRESVQRLQALATRIGPEVPLRTVGNFWKVAALASNGCASAFSRDAAWQAVVIGRELGHGAWRVEALSLAVGLRARMGELDGLQALLDEARAQLLPEMHISRSNFHWAEHRWWLAQGRAAEALACTLLQTQALLPRSDGQDHVLLGGNAAWCELAMGDAAAAEARARAAVEALRAQGATGNPMGYPLQVLAEALFALGRFDDGLAAAREAQPRLAGDSDDVPLLEPLALAAAGRGRVAAAAQVCGHVDAAFAASGRVRWPYEAQVRAAIDAHVIDAIGTHGHDAQRTIGERLSRSDAFRLAFGDDEAGDPR